MKKSTGIVRRLDQLGRVVVPMELRRTLGIKANDPLEIFTDGESIILKKYKRGCVFCGEMEGVVEYGGEVICSKCVENLKSI